MNSLPPELLSSIVEQAAHCDSTYDSYRSRLHTLSALALVNQILHELAQPLLLQKVWLKTEKSLEALGESGSMENVVSLKYEPGWNEVFRTSLQGFSFMTELRVSKIRDFDIMALNGHQHIKRLALEFATLFPGDRFDDFALSSLEEISLDEVKIYYIQSALATTASPSFLTPSHFPSLRNLGIRQFYYHKALEGLTYERVYLNMDSMSQLDCMALDEKEYLDWTDMPDPFSPPPSFPVPVLFDLELFHDEYQGLHATLVPEYAREQTHVRLRLRSEPPPPDRTIRITLGLAIDLLDRSKVLKELYLDHYSPNRKGKVYEQDARLEETRRKFIELGREKKVEIISEDHEGSWCGGRASKEFWRRCREKRGK